MTLEFRVVIRHLGLLMLVLSSLILVVALFACFDHFVAGRGETVEPVAMLIAAAMGVLLSVVLFLLGRKGTALIGQREALVLVALGWLLGAALSALPFYLWSWLRSGPEIPAHDFDTFTNCYFEAMSGLTTTGATVLQSISTVPRSLLLWRAMTHWIGGLGIVVLFVAVLPVLGFGSRRVYWSEAPGVTHEGVRPRIQDTARVLWLIYVGLTVAEVLALKFCGMSWFDATCHTFATLATGGFSTLDASIAGFDSTAIHLVIILFMVLAGINFGLYHQLLQRRWRSVARDAELRAYLAILFVATAIVTVSLVRSGNVGALPQDDPASLPTTLRHAAFQVVAIQTTTGFCSADFDQWGFIAKATLLTLMFVGASAGSTGGGIKVVRILIAAKVMLAELEHYYRPKVVRSVRVGNTAIDSSLRLNTFVYLIGIAVLFGIGTVLLMLLESSQGIDITTAATASAATLNNIGPGLARVGATQNYAWFTAPSKMLMCMFMVLGRLELFTILVLFTPRFWKGE